MSQLEGNRRTFVVNVISGPGGGKSVTTAILFAKLKILQWCAEYVQEVAKGLVWAKDFEMLDNQYWVSQKQFKMLNCLQGKVDFVVTDGCLLHGLYYNRRNKNNVSNVDITEKYILDSYNKFNNINIFLQRGEFQYEQEGRNETEAEALEIDQFFLDYMNQNGIPFEKHFVENKGNDYSVDTMLEYIFRRVDELIRDETNHR